MKLAVNPLAIRVKMAEKNINQSELAEAASLNRGSVILAMDGGNVRLSTVAALAEALQCSPFEILHVEEGQNEIDNGG